MTVKELTDNIVCTSDLDAIWNNLTDKEKEDVLLSTSAYITGTLEMDDAPILDKIELDFKKLENLNEVI